MFYILDKKNRKNLGKRNTLIVNVRKKVYVKSIYL